jgi:putative transposase
MAANPERQEARPVRKSRYSDEQIAAALRQAEAGTPIADITRKLGISEATFYAWRKRFGSLGTPEIRELRQLRDRERAAQAARCGSDA